MDTNKHKINVQINQVHINQVSSDKSRTKEIQKLAEDHRNKNWQATWIAEHRLLTITPLLLKFS